MSLLPPKIPFERAAIGSIKSIGDAVRWLGSFLREFDQWYSIFHDWSLNITCKTLRVGDASDNMQVSKTGDVTFVGDSGLAFAGIYAHDSTDTINVDSDDADTIVDQWSVNVPSNNCTPDQASNKITFTKTGKYFVAFSAAVFLNGGATVQVTFHAFLGGVLQPCLHAHRTISTTNKGSLSFSSFIDVTSVPLDIDVRANIDSATARSLTVEDAQLNVIQVGGT